MAHARAFDELWGAGADGQPRAGFETLSSWLDNTPPAELARRQQSAEAAFRSLGITFAVYGEDEAAERIIPFDILPRVFSGGLRHYEASLRPFTRRLSRFNEREGRASALLH